MFRPVLAASLAAVSCVFAASASAETLDLRFGHAASSQHPFHDGVEMFRDAVAEKTNGAVNIEVYGDRQLGDDRQLLEGVQLGTIDGALVSSVTFSLAADQPAFDGLQLPFLISTYDELADALTSPVAQEMLNGLERAGMVGLGYYEAGLRHYLNRGEPVRTLDDFSGLRTRIVPVPLHEATWQAVGANPVGIAYGEVYTSLQTGVIDAVEINVSSVETENLWENAKHLTMTGHYFWPGVLVVNQTVFEELSPEHQQALIEAGAETIRPQIEYVARHERESLERMKEKGVEAYELDDLMGMQEVMAPVLDRWSGEDPLIAKFIDYVQGG